MPKIDKDIIRERIHACKESQEFAWALPDSVYSDFADTPARNLALLKGTYWNECLSMPSSRKPRVGSNQILPKWQANSATVTSGETEFMAEALTPDADTDSTADVVGAVLTQLWSKHKFDNECKLARWDVACYSFGVVEVGWKFKRGKEELIGERGEPVVDENTPAMAFDEVGMPYTTEPVQEVSSVEDDNAVWGNPTIDDPYVERFAPRYLLVDRNTTRQDLSDCRSAFRIRYEYVEAIKADKRLKNTAKLTGSVYDKSTTTFDSRGGNNNVSVRDDAALVKMYDGYTWIIQGGSKTLWHVIYTDEIDEILLSEPYEYLRKDGEPLFGKNPFPFRICPGAVIDNDSFYQTTKVEQVADKQISFDEGFDQLDNYRRKSVRQFLVDKNLIADETVADGLESGEDGLLIPTEGPPDANAIMQVPYSTGSMDLYKELQELPTEIGRALATNEFEESQIPDKKMLAREVDAVSRQGNSRTQVDMDTYDDFREDVAFCVFMLFDKFGDRARYFNQKDGAGKAQWGQINNESMQIASGAIKKDPVTGDIISETSIDQIYKIKINASSTRAKNKGFEQEKSLKIAEVSMPFIQMGIVDPKAVIRGLYKAFDIDNIDEYIPQPDPAQGGDPTQMIAQALTILSQFPPEVVQQVTAQLQAQQQQGQPGQEQGQPAQQPAQPQGGMT